LRLKVSIFLLTAVCIIATVFTLYIVKGIDPRQLQEWLQSLGIWGPVTFIFLYLTATILVLPSTALNLAGGAIFGPFFGAIWASLGAILAAIVTFTFTRTVGRKVVAKRLTGRWQSMDAEVKRGGLFYMFAIRLIPVMPYGLVNFLAGLTSVTFKDYVIGTTLGTVPSVLPFVMIGSSGVTAVRTGDALPLLGALTLSGILVGGSTWYRHRQRLAHQESTALQLSKQAKHREGQD
jgi:uncharacterized membrane protein YdjX (TVP38/TMEM64 family)